MDDSVFRWTAVEGRYSLKGASYVLSIKLDWQSIRSAIIYDDELAVTFTDPLGHLQWLVMPLVRTYDDVGNIELRGQDDSSDTGWRYVPFEFARGVPDLTPVKVKGTTDNDVLYGGLGADVVKGGKGNDILHGERVSDNHWVGGDDVVDGGAGDDTIYGYRGDDVLNGGKGADIFYFSSRWAIEDLPDDELPADNHDRITDFEVGTDKIGIHDGDGSRLSAKLITRDVDETETVKGLKVTLDEANSIKVNFDTALSVEAWDSLVDGAGGLNELVFTEVWA